MIDNQNIKIAVASGKGGTGKTLVSTNLFQIIENLGLKVTLVDCDAEEPNDMVFFNGDLTKTLSVTQKVPVINEILCMYCGKCQEYCNYNAIFLLPDSKMIRVFDDLCHGCGACTVACKHNAITEKEVLLGQVSSYQIASNSRVVEAKMKVGVYSPVSVIKEAIKLAGDEGIVLFDSPPGTSCPFIQTVAQADFVVLVTEPTPFGLSDLKQSVETLKTMQKPCGVIINRAGMGSREVYVYLENEKIPLLMEIPFDKEIASLYSNGELLLGHKPNFRNQLISMFDTFLNKYGNSHHQR